jgi:hypothetical protein
MQTNQRTAAQRTLSQWMTTHGGNRDTEGRSAAKSTRLSPQIASTPQQLSSQAQKRGFIHPPQKRPEIQATSATHR